MELSRAADYAVRAIVEVASGTSEGMLWTRDIARKQSIPAPMLAKIIPQLTRNGLLRSRRGAGGGVFLGKRAEDISLLEVIESIEGPIVLNRCVRNPQECPLSRTCAIHEVWKQAQTQLRGLLLSVSIAELAARQRQIRETRTSEAGNIADPAKVGFDGRG